MRYHKNQGKEIVVANGVGFVGVVMAAVVADSVDERGNRNKFLIGMQRPSTRSYWKISMRAHTHMAIVGNVLSPIL